MSDTVTISTSPPSILVNSFHLCTLWLLLLLMLLLLWIILLVFPAVKLLVVVFLGGTCSDIELLLWVLLLLWGFLLGLVLVWGDACIVLFGRTCLLFELSVLLLLVGMLLLLW